MESTWWKFVKSGEETLPLSYHVLILYRCGTQCTAKIMWGLEQITMHAPASASACVLANTSEYTSALKCWQRSSVCLPKHLENESHFHRGRPQRRCLNPESRSRSRGVLHIYILLSAVNYFCLYFRYLVRKKKAQLKRPPRRWLEINVDLKLDPQRRVCSAG